MREPRKKLEEPPVGEAIGTGIGITVLSSLLLGIAYGVFVGLKFLFLKALPLMWKTERPTMIGIGIAILACVVFSVGTYAIPRIKNRRTELEKILYEEQDGQQKATS